MLLLPSALFWRTGLLFGWSLTKLCMYSSACHHPLWTAFLAMETWYLIYLCSQYMHINFKSFWLTAIKQHFSLVLFFTLLPMWIAKETSYHIAYSILTNPFFTYMHIRNNTTVTHFTDINEHFLKTHVLLSSLMPLFLFKLNVLWHLAH